MPRVGGILAAALLLGLAARAQGPALTQYELRYSDEVSPYLISVWTVPDNFINTGLSYDPLRHEMLCAHLEFDMSGESIETLHRRDGHRLRDPIPANPYTALLQGLAYDLSDSSYWVWGGDCPYPEKRATHFSAAGAPLPDGFVMPGYPGMLQYDVERDGLWSKACNETMAYLYACADGQVIDAFNTTIAGEGIALDPFDGSFWALTETHLYQIERSGSAAVVLGTYPNPSRYYPPDTLAGYFNAGAAEGLVVDPSDRTLWFNADQHCHGAIPGGNRCWHVDPLGTYDQVLLVPQGLTWSTGVSSGTRVEAGALVLEPGCDQGLYTTAVVDLDEHRPLAAQPTWEPPGVVMVLYRGSDAGPDTPANDHLPLVFHDARQSNLGWGTTVPGPWRTELPDQRYLQVRFLLFGPAAQAPPAPDAVALTVHPNPCRAGGRVTIEAGAAAPGWLGVWDALGRRVRLLPARRVAGAPRCWRWDGRDARGRRLAAGVYYVAPAGSPAGGVRAILLID